MIDVSSSAFDKNGVIPKKHTGEGADTSPPLKFDGIPDNAQSIALICDDPDAPMPKPFVHWVLFNVDPSETSFGEGDNGGGTEGANDFGNNGYGGPMPPEGHGVHRYYFKVYALDTKLDLPAGASKDDLVAAMERHVLDEGELVGTYERK